MILQDWEGENEPFTQNQTEFHPDRGCRFHRNPYDEDGYQRSGEMVGGKMKDYQCKCGYNYKYSNDCKHWIDINDRDLIGSFITKSHYYRKCGEKLPEKPEYADGYYSVRLIGSIYHELAIKHDDNWYIHYPSLCMNTRKIASIERYEVIRKIDLGD